MGGWVGWGGGGEGDEVDLHGDGAAWDRGAGVDGARRPIAYTNDDSAAGASAHAWDGAFDVRAPVIPQRPGGEVRDAVREDVELLRCDDGGGGVANEGFKAGCGCAVVRDESVVTKKARYGPCRCP